MFDAVTSVLVVVDHEYDIMMAACLFIAAEYAEDTQPYPEDYVEAQVQAGKKIFSKEDLLEFRERIITILGYDILFTTTYDYFDVDTDKLSSKNRQMLKTIIIMISISSLRFEYMPQELYYAALSLVLQFQTMDQNITPAGRKFIAIANDEFNEEIKDQFDLMLLKNDVLLSINSIFEALLL
jgi:hypothetical protein